MRQIHLKFYIILKRIFANLRDFGCVQIIRKLRMKFGIFIEIFGKIFEILEGSRGLDKLSQINFELNRFD